MQKKKIIIKKNMCATENALISFWPTFQLQIRIFQDNSKILFFSFLSENIRCDPLLEPSRRDGSNEGSQRIFLCRNVENHS